VTFFAEIARILEKELSTRRFQHSLSVARLAGELAERHGADIEEARLCGLVHDCAKEWKPGALVAYVKKRRLKIPHIDHILPSNPNLLHAYVSADVARRNGWLRSAAAERAVAAHTLGCVPMGKLETIVYIADLASYDRAFRGVRTVRAVARKDLRRGLRAALAVKIGHQLRKNKSIHPVTIAVWNSLAEAKA
jgi:predicted HD superfamily hydrolase involved in NAD metabolism